MAVIISRRSSYCPNFATTPSAVTVVWSCGQLDGRLSSSSELEGGETTRYCNPTSVALSHF